MAVSKCLGSKIFLIQEFVNKSRGCLFPATGNKQEKIPQLILTTLPIWPMIMVIGPEDLLDQLYICIV
ncbi:hypothetical protein MLD38_039524 [Melastoma candidum]|uniref:Uncharacterized protein n=1 Tax=Melastoma candidum TaxID=119954 RepID=A0ACB9L2T0_9MYRT|nr:hypothetical protein MLD38_039524 [Melastoma candidum]